MCLDIINFFVSYSQSNRDKENEENAKINKVIVSKNNFKVFIFVNITDEMEMLTLISKVGAGVIGDFRDCTFTSDAILRKKLKGECLTLKVKNIETVVTRDKVKNLTKELSEFQSKKLCFYSIVPTVKLPPLMIESKL